MDKLSQCKKILRHMQTIGPISPKDAEDLYACMRLAARIADLRKSGYEINTEIVHDSKTKACHAVYSMAHTP